MAISLKDLETDKLARKLAKLTGESITTTIKTALKERLERAERCLKSDASLAQELDAIAKRCAALPIRDGRSADQILGYNASGGLS
jgi:antitoxin VapB